MIVGGALVAVGTRVTWVEASLRGAPVSSPGLPPVFLGRGVLTLSGGDVGAGYLFGLGLLAAFVPLGWVVSGPRGRVALGVAGLLLAAGIGIGVANARADATARAERVVRAGSAGDAPSFTVATGPGPAVAGGGAALAGLCAVGGAVAGRRVPKLRMPDPPDKGAPA